MDKIKVDTTDLRDTAKDLETIAHEFKDADKNSAALAAAVGHPGLANHITSFSMNWTQRRADMVKTIDELQKKLTEGADALEKADSHLAAELKSSPAPTAPVPAGGHSNGGPR